MRKKLLLCAAAWLVIAPARASLSTAPAEEAVAQIEAMVKKNKPKTSDINELAAALRSPDTAIQVKERAAWALGELDAKAAIDTLIAAAKHKGLLVRSAALNALIRLRAKTALPTFVEIAQNDPILSLRQSATLGLGLLQTEKAIDPLVKLSEDPSPEIRGASVLAMASLHSNKNNFSELLQEMSADANPYVEERVKRGLEVTGRRTTSVSKQLESPDVDIRLFAALYFQQRGTSKDLKTLNAALSGESDEETRAQLKRSIAAIKRRAAEEAKKKAQKEEAAKKKN